VVETVESNTQILGIRDGNDANPGGHQLGDVGGASDGNQPTYEAENSTNAKAGSQSGTIHGQATETVISDVVGTNLDQGGMDLDDSSDYDEEPMRFRSLSDVYEDTVEVDLASDT